MEEKKEYEGKILKPRDTYYVIQELEKNKIIRSAKLLKILLKITKVDRKIHMGYYTFNNHMSTIEIFFLIKEAKQVMTSIPIIEGYDIYDISKVLLSRGIIDEEKVFIFAMHSKKWIDIVRKRFEIKHPIDSIEGFIYPETYFIPKGSTYDTFVQLALQTFEQKIYTLYGREPSFYRHLIIASLIEKETVITHERPIVSSVIHNRLKKSMKLEIDPTIIYSIKKMNLVQESLKNGKINIQRKHFFLASPYNSYYSKKLPPTPISSVSISSLEAAYSPEKTEYLFFVANPKTGEHTFTKTFKEHDRWVKKYTRERLTILRNKKKSF